MMFIEATCLLLALAATCIAAYHWTCHRRLRRVASALSIKAEQQAIELSNQTARREQVESEHAFSEERHRAIVDEMADGYWETDLRGNRTFVNHRVSQWHDRTVSELTASGNAGLGMDEESLGKFREAFREVYRTARPYRGLEYKESRTDGSIRCLQASIWLIKDHDGNPTGFRGISRDITHRKEIERALEEAKESAEAANRSKSQFLAMMSHEIRTPMNGIIGMTNLALDTKLSDEQRESLELVKASADSLLTIINDILDFSKIEAGKLQLESVDFGLRKLIERALKPFYLRAAEKGLTLRFDVDPGTTERLIGDPIRVLQIINNLIGNALKFTDEGEVLVRVFAEESSDQHVVLHFVVVDTGIGVAAEQLKTIFESFSQADRSITRRFGGTGLGLTITSRLVNAMDGRIWVKSEPGKGSEFHFTARFLIDRASAETGLEQQLSGSIRERSKALRVLLAEDNRINQRLAVRLLEKNGHDVVVASNGCAAVEAYSNDEFDLVLMDIEMPLMDGYEATRTIRETQSISGRRVPIIAMTAHAMTGDKEKCLEAGMDGYVSKPINVAELLEAIETITSVDHVASHAVSIIET